MIIKGASIVEDDLEISGPSQQKRVKGTVTVSVDVDYISFFGKFHKQEEEDQFKTMKKIIDDEILRKFS